MKFKRGLAYFTLILAGGLTISLIVFAVTGIEHLPTMLILRGFIVIPFGVWLGLRTLRKAQEEEHPIDKQFATRLKELADKQPSQSGGDGNEPT